MYRAHTHTNLPPSKMFLARDEAVSGLYLPLIAYLDKCDTMAEIMSVWIWNEQHRHHPDWRVEIEKASLTLTEYVCNYIWIEREQKCGGIIYKWNDMVSMLSATSEKLWKNRHTFPTMQSRDSRFSHIQSLSLSVSVFSSGKIMIKKYSIFVLRNENFYSYPRHFLCCFVVVYIFAFFSSSFGTSKEKKLCTVCALRFSSFRKQCK